MYLVILPALGHKTNRYVDEYGWSLSQYPIMGDALSLVSSLEQP
jgi:hypothetical protein